MHRRLCRKNRRRSRGNDALSIHANHVNMCKFKSETDSNYILVAEALGRWAKEIERRKESENPKSVCCADREREELCADASLGYLKLHLEHQFLEHQEQGVSSWTIQCRVRICDTEFWALFQGVIPEISSGLQLWRLFGGLNYSISGGSLGDHLAIDWLPSQTIFDLWYNKFLDESLVRSA